MLPVDPAVWSYLLYVASSVTLTIWVARTLHKNGRIFLVDAFTATKPWPIPSTTSWWSGSIWSTSDTCSSPSSRP